MRIKTSPVLVTIRPTVSTEVRLDFLTVLPVAAHVIIPLLPSSFSMLMGLAYNLDTESASS